MAICPRLAALCLKNIYQFSFLSQMSKQPRVDDMEMLLWDCLIPAEDLGRKNWIPSNLEQITVESCQVALIWK